MTMPEQLQLEEAPLYPSPEEKGEDNARGDRIAIYVAYLGRFYTDILFTSGLILGEEDEEKENADPKQTKAPS